MKRLLTLGLAICAFGLANTATAQMTSSTTAIGPNGGVRTTTRTVTPNGTATTRTVDRPDGTRTVTRSRTDVMGNRHTVTRRRGSSMVRVCNSHWQGGHRVRRCHMRPRWR